MQSTLTWLDLTAGDREKLRRILDLFNEKGTLDELGLSSLRDMFSEALFPGINTTQTRLRYVLLVPWIYRSLETKGLGRDKDVTAEARKSEIKLIGTLLESDDWEGTIGVNAREALVRLPSDIYWGALNQWGIFKGYESQWRYHRNFHSRKPQRELVEDDQGIERDKNSKWHVRLPDPPSEFPWKASLSLTREEADFLLGRLQENCKGTLLGWLATNGSKDEMDHNHLWETSASKNASVDLRETIEYARRFSLHVEGMSILYNLLIAEDRIDLGIATDDEKRDRRYVEHYKAQLGDWAVLETKEKLYDSADLYDFAAGRGVNLSYPQIQFIETWGTRIKAVGAHRLVADKETHQLIREREWRLKGKRARLHSLDRLRDWSGGVGLGRMEFRWYTARRLLRDLYAGLNR
ncbi:MAG: DUF6361 family protein [Gammaproteobacteria bacterium]|nr:DUF6361 family protein [Gammaproteobacteria bacterium]MDE0252742.1 DUF6361 family protein [Gammaproteobacteria bacterium]MDE0402242.1 DUF6361 family protein [Gammaproteobacteria bacterium]